MLQCDFIANKKKLRTYILHKHKPKKKQPTKNKCYHYQLDIAMLIPDKPDFEAKAVVEI